MAPTFFVGDGGFLVRLKKAAKKVDVFSVRIAFVGVYEANQELLPGYAG